MATRMAARAGGGRPLASRVALVGAAGMSVYGASAGVFAGGARRWTSSSALSSPPERNDGWTDGVRDGVVGAIGKTPLVRLHTLSEQTGCEILAKAEWMQPGGSVKDRAARFIIEDAERRGVLKPGGTVVEGTAGNTGIGLAHLCLARGYKCVIFMPDTQSQEKIDTLRMLGADVRPVPAVPYTNPTMYQHQAREFADTLENAVHGNQFDNTVNAEAHYHTTAPEIWKQTAGKIDVFTCASGTAGTIAGTSRRLKELNPEIRTFVADPPGSCIYNYIKTGKLERKGDGSITEGIANGRATHNLQWGEQYIDDALFIPDERTVQMVFHLLHREGIFVGASSALNAVAAVEAARAVGPGKTVVTVLCDAGYRYASRLLSAKWLESKGLLTAVPEAYRSSLLP